MGLVVVVLVGGCGGSGTEPVAVRAGAIASGAVAATAEAVRTSQVTLITGDRVTFRHGGDSEPVLWVEHAPGRERIEMIAHVTRRNGAVDLVVLPRDAAPLVAAGQLDLQLFDVSELVREGLDDDSGATLPVIVTYATAMPVRSWAATGARATRWLASIGGDAIVVDKHDGGAFWSWLTDGAARRGGAARTLTPAVKKVWLDDTRLSGTSMATAHVAGRAALLAQLDGVNRVETAIDVFESPEMHNLTIATLDSSGAPAQFVDGTVFNLDTGNFTSFVVAGTTTLRLEKGEYDISEVVADGSRVFFGAHPSVVLDHDISVTIDGRTAQPVTAVVDPPSATLQANSVALHSVTRGGIGTTITTLADYPLSVTPTAKVSDHLFTMDFRDWLGPPPGSPPMENYLYNLAFGIAGGVPEHTTFRVRDCELGIVYAHYYSPGDAVGYRSSLGITPDNASAFIALTPQPLPGTRLEYYTANLPWTETLQLYAANGNVGGERTVGDVSYQPGGFYLREWGRAPIGPGFGPRANGWGAYRTGNKLGVLLAPFSPNESEHGTLTWNGSTTLSRDGALLGTANLAGLAAFTVPADDGVYQLAVHGTRIVPWSTVGTGLDAAWTFHSAPAGDTLRHDLPLLLVRASAPVDDNDAALAGLPYVLSLQVERQSGAPHAAITELTLDASYDDGATFTPATVVFAGDRGLALVFHPRAPGFVTLRAHARDADGNDVTQTVARAYRTTALR
jgi:hypothetical protein